MIVERHLDESLKEYRLLIPDSEGELVTHQRTEDCDEHGCAVHNPSSMAIANREEWPYNWRTDRGILERICRHGIGHPDPDSARFYERQGQGRAMNTHGCDGCCIGITFNNSPTPTQEES